MTIKMVCISDTHCQLSKVKLPDGDMLIHAGDALSRGTYSEFISFINKMEKLANNKYKYVIYVPGNHDIITEENEALVKSECAKRNVIYLNNSGVTLEGFNFWGSGITPRFHDWAWNRDSGRCGTSKPPEHPLYKPIEPYWDMIPNNTDVLITHGPPKGFLDISIYNGVHCGCPQLLDKLLEVKPKFHIFGHIHFYGGQTVKLNNDTTLVNASVCNEQYKPLNKITVIEICEKFVPVSVKALLKY